MFDWESEGGANKSHHVLGENNENRLGNTKLKCNMLSNFNPIHFISLKCVHVKNMTTQVTRQIRLLLQHKDNYQSYNHQIQYSGQKSNKLAQHARKKYCDFSTN